MKNSIKIIVACLLVNAFQNMNCVAQDTISYAIKYYNTGEFKTTGDSIFGLNCIIGYSGIDTTTQRVYVEDVRGRYYGITAGDTVSEVLEYSETPEGVVLDLRSDTLMIYPTNVMITGESGTRDTLYYKDPFGNVFSYYQLKWMRESRNKKQTQPQE